MLLIILLCLIAKLMLVSSYCDIGTHDVKYFDWYKICIILLTRFLKQVDVTNAALAL
jgi:hypothetical protein